MPGFNTYQEIVAAQRAGSVKTFDFFRTPLLAPTTGNSTWQSLWFASANNEKPPGGITVPGIPGTTYTDSAFSMTFPAVSPRRKFITKIGAIASQPVTLMIYDRLAAVGGLEFDLGYTVNTPALPRYTDGYGVQAWVEAISGTNNVSTRISSYTNQDGVAGRSGASLQAVQLLTAYSTLMFGPLPLQAGDRGIRTIQQVQGTTAATTATYSLTLLKPLLMIPLSQNLWYERDLALESMLLPEIFDGASLCMAIQVANAASTTIQGQLEVTWG
jgi:hypothetical protein